MVDLVVFAILPALAGCCLVTRGFTTLGAFGDFAGDFAAGLAAGLVVRFTATGAFAGRAGAFIAFVAAFVAAFTFGAAAVLTLGAATLGRALVVDRLPAFVTGLLVTFVAAFTSFGPLGEVAGGVARGRASVPLPLPATGARSSEMGPLTFGVTDTCARFAGAGIEPLKGVATGIGAPVRAALRTAWGAEEAFATTAATGLAGRGARVGGGATTAVGVLIQMPMAGRRGVTATAGRLTGATDRATPVALRVSPLPSFAAGRTAVRAPRPAGNAVTAVATAVRGGRCLDRPGVSPLAPVTPTSVVSARPCLTFTLAAPTFRNECHTSSVCLRDRIIPYDATDVN